ncbi:MAG: beta-ketoacyl-ACP synthase [Gammaproteobacteria bacterium]|nr:beta-ketoacyl-ACP synthase [Gammaproteobacteria bacterium]MDH3428613.1 beta-ketoacyl-ACP synthase [Gammaproteobacteria bacterium]MDH3432551.1 beta-ketoacyl-ACP synthase [Gammaproteobacteria bacterium]
MNRRVVVTGMAGLTSLGHDWDSIRENVVAGRSGIQRLDEFARYDGLNTNLGAPIDNFELPGHYTRKRTRSMGRVSMFSTITTEQALQQAGLLGDPIVSSGDMGIAYGSSSGSPPAIAEFGAMLHEYSTRTVTATSYIRMMPHTAAVNTGLFFNIRGRLISTCTACTSGSQAIGFAYEAIKQGKQKAMVAGGAEELSATQAAVFDILFATSVRNDEPGKTPRPFDRDRDGLVIGEGAATLVLEDLEHAQQRGAPIIAELIGFATNCDAMHVTQPTAETMEVAMRLGLQDANLDADAVGYVSAHGTATDLGDVAESQATNAVFGSNMPISSLKSYFGHSLGACGAQEVWLTIEMMNRDEFWPTLNLDNLEPRCAELDYIVGEPRNISTDYVVSNSFAFGGINTSLVFKRWS